MSDAPQGLDEFISQPKPTTPTNEDTAPSGLDEFIKPEVEHAKYGEGVVNPLKAFGAGVARGLTFGASDVGLTKSGLTTPETLAGLQKENPVLSPLGETAGIGLGIFAAPEAAVLKEAQGALKAAELTGDAAKIGEATKALGAAKAVKAADFISPVYGVSKAAGALGSSVAPIIGGTAAAALGSGIEATAYGLGQTVTEASLGDPDVNGEKLAHNLVSSALFGGAIGGGVHLLSEAASAIIPKFISDTDKAAINAGDFGAAVKASDIPNKDGIISGMSNLKPNAEEIKSAAGDLGAPVLAGQISDSKAVQKAQSLLLDGPPTYAAIKQQQLASEGFQKVQSALDDVLGSESNHTRASLGEALQDSLTSKVTEQVKPINDIYNEIKRNFNVIPVAEEELKKASKDLLNIDILRLAPSGPEAKLINRVSEEIGNLKSVDDIKQYATYLRNSLSKTASSEEKHVVSVLAGKLGELEENSIVSFAKEHASVGGAEDRILSLLNDREAANAHYSIFKDKIQRVGEVLGKRRIYGAQDFINFIGEITPEQVSDKLFAKNNSKFLKYFSEQFPEEMDLISQYQKNSIRDAALKDGVINSRQVLKNIDKLQPEVKEILFKPDELNKIQSAKTYLGSFPEKFNPSNTSNATAFRSFFENPIKAAVGNVRDAALSKYIQKAVDTGDQEAIRIANLGQIEREAQKSSRSISSGIKDIFNSSKELKEPLIGFAASKLSMEDRENRFNKVISKIGELNNDPSKMLDTLDKTTKTMYAHAPQTAQGVNMALSRATQFLASKIPQQDAPAPLSEPPKPSETEISKFERYVKTVEDPMHVLSDVKSGMLTPESMETLQTVYPKLYGEMQQSLMERLIDKKAKKDLSKLPYRTKLSLSMFMQQDLDNSLKQPNIMANQVALAGIQAAKQEKEQAALGNVRTTAKGLGKVDLASRMETHAQESNTRGLKS